MTPWVGIYITHLGDSSPSSRTVQDLELLHNICPFSRCFILTMLASTISALAALTGILAVAAAPAPLLSTANHLATRSTSYPCNSPLTILDAGDWTQVRALDNSWAGFGGFAEASRFTFQFDGVNSKDEHFNVTVYEHTAPTWWEAFQHPLQTKSSWNVSELGMRPRASDSCAVSDRRAGRPGRKRMRAHHSWRGGAGHQWAIWSRVSQLSTHLGGWVD